jgi:hypothetical protein
MQWRPCSVPQSLREEIRLIRCSMLYESDACGAVGDLFEPRSIGNLSLNEFR